jgi:uncharacterized ubiquitin-like protein YukD
MNKVAIYGGLGNQMFQYALCVALNHRGKKSRISFSSYLISYHHDGFNLCNAFKIRLRFPYYFLNTFLIHGTFLYKNRYIGFFLKRLIPGVHRKSNKYLEKKEFEFDPDVFNQTDCTFVGIWQVEEYFIDIREQIIKEFEFRVPEDQSNKELINRITQTESVSIHIRRGDYLSDRWKNILGVINGNKYYLTAIDYISSKVMDPCYFVFSDDIGWAKDNLELKNCIFIDHNKRGNSYIDMYLMSLCKHNIIANSTFSWWAAWLNKNDEKIVVMPDRWLVGENCKGIFPSQWTKIETD